MCVHVCLVAVALSPQIPSLKWHKLTCCFFRHLHQQNESLILLEMDKLLTVSQLTKVQVTVKFGKVWITL